MRITSVIVTWQEMNSTLRTLSEKHCDNMAQSVEKMRIKLNHHFTILLIIWLLGMTLIAFIQYLISVIFNNIIFSFRTALRTRKKLKLTLTQYCDVPND